MVTSVLNGERFLGEAIESILAQTFGDFEYIIVNDGSTDGTAAILGTYAGKDSRLRVYHQENRGTCPSDNRACAMARGKYIAHLDADDVSLPDRLERQVKFLENHEDVGLLGGAFEGIDDQGRLICVERPPLDDESIRAQFRSFSAPFLHSALMMRKQAYDAAGGYRCQFLRSEDLDLSLRIMESWKTANLPEVVVRRRVHTKQVSFCYARQQIFSDLAAYALASARQLRGVEPPCDVPVITESYLEKLGVSQAARHQALVAYQVQWIRLMSQIAQDDAVLRSVDELIQLSRSGPVDSASLANAMLVAARIHSRHGRRFHALAFMVRRATLTGPIVLKHMMWDIFVNRTYPLRKRLGLRRRVRIEQDAR